MINKDSLLHLVARAERGALLPGEAQILRDAVEMLDDLAMTLDTMSNGQLRSAGYFRDYSPSDTQTFRALTDDDAPGRP